MAERPVSEYPVRIGIIGGRFSMGFPFEKHPDCVVAAVAERDPQRRKQLAERHPRAQVYEEMDDLLADAAINAVGLYTFAPGHGPEAVRVLEAGKHLLSAVPACITLEEAERLIEAKERTGLTYMMAETSCYRAPAMAAREWHAQGLFGRLFHSNTEYCHPLAHHSAKGKAERDMLWWHEGKPTWRFCFPPALYPTHSTAFVIHVTGEPFTEVSCFGWMDEDDPDRTSGISPYGDNRGTFVCLLRGRDGHLSTMKLDRSGTVMGERAELFGTQLSMYMENESTGAPFALHGPNAEACGPLSNFHERLPEPLRADSGHGGSHPFIVHEFVSAIVEEREPEVDLYTALNMTVPGIIAHESSQRDGECLKIPVFERASVLAAK